MRYPGGTRVLSSNRPSQDMPGDQTRRVRDCDGFGHRSSASGSAEVTTWESPSIGPFDAAASLAAAKTSSGKDTVHRKISSKLIGNVPKLQESQQYLGKQKGVP
jgi:hypothetical protein